MKKVLKLGKEIVEMNVIVYAATNESLWEYRNLFYQIREDKAYQVQLTLTRSFSTLKEVSRFIAGGIDLIFFMALARADTLCKLQEIVGKQKMAGLILYEREGVLWEYYQNGAAVESEHIPIKTGSELYELTELVCDYMEAVEMSKKVDCI